MKKEHQPYLHLLQGSQRAQQALGDPQGLVLHLSQQGPGDLFLPVSKTQQIVYFVIRNLQITYLLQFLKCSSVILCLPFLMRKLLNIAKKNNIFK